MTKHIAGPIYNEIIARLKKKGIDTDGIFLVAQGRGKWVSYRILTAEWESLGEYKPANDCLILNKGIKTFKELCARYEIDPVDFAERYDVPYTKVVQRWFAGVEQPEPWLLNILKDLFEYQPEL